MKKNLLTLTIHLGCLGLATLLLFVFGVRCCVTAWKNHTIASVYTDDEKISPYEAGIPMEEMDMMAYWEFLDLPRAYVDNSMEYTTFLLPCDITYYEMRDGRYIPVYTLTAGMRVVAIDGNERYLTGYGDVSYPTYTRGWRYVRPYLTTDDPEAPPVWGADDPRLAGVPFYYARVEELTEILLYLSQQSAGGQEPIEYGDWLGDYLKNYGFFTQKRALLLQTDAVLRWFGIYLSPDYRLPYFDTTNIVLLSAAGVLLTLHIVLRVRRARQQRQVEGGRK